MEKKIKRVVMIHGCHTGAQGWENIVWGNPPQVLGRALKGVDQALLVGADLIMWGSGGSQKEGLREATYTFRFTKEKLMKLRMWQGKRSEEITAYLDRVSVLDEVSQNTAQEIAAAFALCEERGIEELYLTSSATHIARCLQ